MTMIAWSKPALSASINAWWITGSSPSGSISFGMARVSGRKRVPKPAAGMTMRIRVVSSGRHQRAEARVLFRPKPVAEPALRQLDVPVRDHLVLRDIAAKAATLGQAHGQQPLRCGDVRVLALAVGKVAANAVEHVSAAEDLLGGGDDVDHRTTERGQHRVLEKHRARHRGGHLE